MTSIYAKPPGDMPRPFQPDRGMGDDRAGAGGSFGDTLLAMLDRALMTAADGQASDLPGGTMRSNVEMFNEHGFFDRGATIAASAQLLADAPVAVVPPPIALPSALAGPEAQAAVAAVDGPGALTASHTSDFLPHFGSHQPLAAARARPLIRPARTAPVITRTVGASIAGLDDGEEIPAARAAAKRTATATPQSASRLKVTLDRGEDGVAVSVTADIDPADDHEGMRDAVSQMLARHGLVLSELRVTRRPDSDQGRG